MPRRILTRGPRNPLRSRRGGFLLAAGILEVTYGYGLLPRSNVPETTLRNLSSAFRIMGPRSWGIVWLVVGGLVVLGSMAKFDRWFFTLGSALLTAWSLFFAGAWLSGDGIGRPWLSFVIFGSAAAMVTITAGWDDETVIHVDGRPS